MPVPASTGAGVAQSGYGLDDGAIDVRSPIEAREFFSNLCVQTGSEAHPASCTMGNGGPFDGGKAWPGRDAPLTPLKCRGRQWVGDINSLPPACP
jgi:hypothetical protein